MKKIQKTNDGLSTPVRILIAVGVLLGVTGVVQAVVLDAADVIDAPAVVANDAPTNDRPQLFAERVVVELPSSVRCNNITSEPGEAVSDRIAAGEVVDSYTIFYNTPESGISGTQTKTWTFDSEVICVMSDQLYQGTTDAMLGHPDTTYPIGVTSGRGLELSAGDSYQIAGNSLTVTMAAEEPGDWIRVLTRVSVPEDDNPPVVYCEPGVNPAGKEKENKGNENNSGVDKFVRLVGADAEDGPVEVILYDTVSETVFGPYDAGANVQINIAKGARAKETVIGKEIDYRLSVQGETLLRATDTAGNTTEVSCTK